MKDLRIACLCLFALAILAGAPQTIQAQDKNKDLIVGKWLPTDAKAKESGAYVEFAKDGNMTVSVGPLTLKGKYKFSDEKTVEVEFDVMGMAVKDKLTVKSVTKDELVTVDSKGKEEKMTRAKK